MRADVWSGPSKLPPAMSRWAISANRIALWLAYLDERRGFRTLGDYPPMPTGGYGTPIRLPQAANRELLDALWAKKQTIVALAEESERDGNAWSQDEFAELCRSEFEAILGAKVAR